MLGELILKQYDLLHFAGHCVYDAEDPANSGWIFPRRKTSGSVPTSSTGSTAFRSSFFPMRASRASRQTVPTLRSAELAPSFRRSILPAWRGEFRLRCVAGGRPGQRVILRTDFIPGLLGLIKVGEPEAMHVAMREARVHIATRGDGGGARTWGAYQHYWQPVFSPF